MIRYDIYPNMKRRCIILSFVVGHFNDQRLLDLLNEYQLKATFYVNETIDKFHELYKGHEIVYSTEGKSILSQVSGKPLIKEIVMDSVHYKEALNLCDVFRNNMKFLSGNPILHIWGNSCELVTEEEWEKLRIIFEKISRNKNIWYATQSDIFQYIMAQKELIIDSDENYFYNPTNTDVWIRRDDTESMCIPAGRKMNLRYSDRHPFKTILSEEKKMGRFTVVQNQVEVQGAICPYDYLKIGEGVCILPFVEGNILTLKQYRYPIKSWQRELPGGFVDEGESPQEAAIRELSEETGYMVKEISSLGEFYPSFGSTNEKIHLFKAVCGDVGDTHKEVSEMIHMEIIPVDVFKEEIRNGKFMHGAGLAAWVKYIEER